MRFYSAGIPWGDILPRYAFLEPLLVDKRILEVDCGDGTGAKYLLKKGAAHVTGVKANEEIQPHDVNHQESSEGLLLTHYDGSSLDFASASFDMVCAFSLTDRMDPSLLSEIERVLKPNGHLITALPHSSYTTIFGVSPSRQVAPFEKFVSWLQERFTSVSIFVQSPFLGFSIGWMGADSQDAPLEMDTSMLDEDTEEIAYYLAICGRNPVQIESQSLVQLPFSQVVDDTSEHLKAKSIKAKEDICKQQAEKIKHLEQRIAEQESQIIEQNEELNLRRIKEAENQQQLSDKALLAEQMDQRRVELSEQLTILEGRVAAAQSESEALRRELLQKEQAMERLRWELQERHDEHILVRRDILNTILGRAEGEPLEMDDLVKILRASMGQRDEALEQIQQLTKENETLHQAAEEQRDWLHVLEGDLAAKTKTIEQLRNTIASLNAGLEEKTSWLQASRSENEKIEKQLADREKLLSKLEKQIADLLKQKAQKAKNRTDQQVLVASLREENKGLKHSIENIGVELDKARQENKDMQEELASATQAIELRVQQSEKLLEELQLQQNAQRDITRLSEERLNRIHELERDLKTSKKSLGRLEHELTMANNEQKRLQEILSKEKKKVDQAEQDKQALSTELNDREEELRELRSTLTQETGRRAKLEKLLSEEKARVSELESDLVALVNRMEEGKAKDHHRTNALRELEDSQKRQQQDLEDAREKIDELTRELYEARKHEEDLMAALDLMRSAVIEQEQLRQELENKLDHLELADDDINRQLEQELNRTQADLAIARRKLANAEQASSNAEKTIERTEAEKKFLTRQIQQVQDKLSETSDNLEKLRAKAQKAVELEQDLAWHKQELERESSRAANLEEEMEEVNWEVEQLRSENSDLQEQQQLLSSQKEELIQQRDKLNETITKLETSLKQIEERALKLETSKSEETSRAEAFRQQLDQREQDLHHATKKLETESLRNKQLLDQLEDLRVKAEQERVPLEEELQLALEREKVLQSRIATMQKQLAEIEDHTSTEISALGEQMRRREEQMHAMTERLSEMEQQKSWWEQRAQELADKKEHANKLLKELQDDMTRLIAVKNELEQSEKDSTARLASLEEQVRAALGRVEKLQTRIEVAEREKTDAMNRAEQFTSKMTEVQQELDKAQKRCRLLESGKASEDGGQNAPGAAAQVAKLEAEVGGAKRRIAELETEVHRLRTVKTDDQRRLEQEHMNLRQQIAERDSHLKLLQQQLNSHSVSSHGQKPDSGD